MSNEGELFRSNGVDRRTFLKVGGAAVSALALGGTVLGACGKEEPKDTSTTAASGSGKKRTVVYASPAISYPFFVPVKVGLHDACTQLGWEYVEISEGEYSSETLAKSINTGAQLKPDVLMTGAEEKAAYGPLEDAKKQGILAMCVNANELPDLALKMGLPAVCANQRLSGFEVGAKLAELAAENGAKSGVVLVGTAYPTSGSQVNRYEGIKEGVASANREQGTDFSTTYFTDKAAEDPAQATSLYQAQILRLGSKLAGIACPSGTTSVPPLIEALQQAGIVGEVPVGSWDIDEVEVKAVEDGNITFFKDQGDYYQGYLAVFDAFGALERGREPIDLVCEGGFVTKDNIAQFKEASALVEKLAKEI